MSRCSANVDRIMDFVAVVLALRVATPIPDLVSRTSYSRANVYRLIERMRQHFPIEVIDGVSGGPNHLRRSATVRGLRNQ